MANKKCPECFGKINLEATKCMHCGHQMSEIEMQAANSKARNDSLGCWLLLLGLGAFLLFTCNTSDNDKPTAAKTMDAERGLPTERRQLQIDRFSWEAYGDTYCKASAKFTNTGDLPLRFVRATLQFLKREALIGSDTSYLDDKELSPGASSTFDAMYKCPGSKASVEISAVSRGDVVEVVDPPKRK